MTSIVPYEDLQPGGIGGETAPVGVGSYARGGSSSAIARRLVAIVLFVLVIPIYLIGAPPVIGDAVTDQPDIATAAAVAAAVAVAAATPPASAPRQQESNALSRCAECLRSSPCGTWVVAIALIVVVGATGIVLVRAARILQGSISISSLTASFFFWLGVGYLILLLIIATFYAVQRGSARPYLLGGLLPIAVPWFGAMGAVTISLAGVFFYSDKGWDNQYNYWHIGRPLFGAVLAIVSYFMFILILSSAGTKIPIWESSPPPQARDFIIYYVLAFLVGYREETFRDLIQRVTDLILKPSTTAAVGSPSVSFKKSGVILTNADFDTGIAGTPSVWTIDIVNIGNGTLKVPTVALDKGSAPEYTMGNDHVAGLIELKAGEARSVDITFSPTVGPKAFTGALIVTGSNLNKAARLPLTGKS